MAYQGQSQLQLPELESVRRLRESRFQEGGPGSGPKGHNGKSEEQGGSKILDSDSKKRINSKAAITKAKNFLKTSGLNLKKELSSIKFKRGGDGEYDPTKKGVVGIRQLESPYVILHEIGHAIMDGKNIPSSVVKEWLLARNAAIKLSGGYAGSDKEKTSEGYFKLLSSLQKRGTISAGQKSPENLKKLSVSAYSFVDIDEHLAEAFAHYAVGNADELKRVSPNTYQFLSKLVGR